MTSTMTPEINQFRIMRVLTWSMPVYVLLFGLTWGVLGQNIPPYNGNFPAEELAQIFRENRVSMALGFAAAAATTGLYMVWSVALYGIMRRMEGPGGMLSLLQLMGGSLTTLVPMIACIIWLTAAYRPEQPAFLIRTLYDLGWLTMDIGFVVTTIQYCAAGFLFLRDPREKPLFPRWLCWLGIWLGLEFLLEIIMPLFRSGPFSWAGLFNYWIPFGGPFLWSIIMTGYMLKAVTRLEAESKLAEQPNQ